MRRRLRSGLKPHPRCRNRRSDLFSSGGSRAAAFSSFLPVTAGWHTNLKDCRYAGPNLWHIFLRTSVPVLRKLMLNSAAFILCFSVVFITFGLLIALGVLLLLGRFTMISNYWSLLNRFHLREGVCA